MEKSEAARNVSARSQVQASKATRAYRAPEAPPVGPRRDEEAARIRSREVAAAIQKCEERTRGAAKSRAHSNGADDPGCDGRGLSSCTGCWLKFETRGRRGRRPRLPSGVIVVIVKASQACLLSAAQKRIAMRTPGPLSESTHVAVRVRAPLGRSAFRHRHCRHTERQSKTTSAPTRCHADHCARFSFGARHQAPNPK